MAKATGFALHLLQLSVRFIQGYRFLDRCGESLIALENTLAPGWIPTETSPTTGSMRNDQLGLALAFNSEAMNVRQSEFLAFDHFRDQSCRIYETLWQTLGINRVNVPSLRFQLQKGFSEERADEAEAFLWKMKLSDPNPKLLAVLGGEHAAFDFTVVTEQEVKDAGVPILQRRRFQASVVRQAKQQTLDSRILQRASLLPAKQNEALRAMLRMKSSHPEIAPVAVQVDVEHSLEREFSTKDLDMAGFIAESWQWAESVLSFVNSITRA